MEAGRLLSRTGAHLVPCGAFILDDGESAVIAFNPEDGPEVSSAAPGPFPMLLYRGRPCFAHASRVSTSPPVAPQTFLWHHGTKTDMVVHEMRHLTPSAWASLTDRFRTLAPRDIISKAFADALAIDDEDEDEDEEEDEEEEDKNQDDSKLSRVDEVDEDEDDHDDHDNDDGVDDDDNDDDDDDDDDDEADGMSDISDGEVDEAVQEVLISAPANAVEAAAAAGAAAGGDDEEED